jgi:hypothetical protein
MNHKKYLLSFSLSNNLFENCLMSRSRINDFERLILCWILLEPLDVEVGYRAITNILLISLKHW